MSSREVINDRPSVTGEKSGLVNYVWPKLKGRGPGRPKGRSNIPVGDPRKAASDRRKANRLKRKALADANSDNDILNTADTDMTLRCTPNSSSGNNSTAISLLSTASAMPIGLATTSLASISSSVNSSSGQLATSAPLTAAASLKRSKVKASRIERAKSSTPARHSASNRLQKESNRERQAPVQPNNPASIPSQPIQYNEQMIQWLHQQAVLGQAPFSHGWQSLESASPFGAIPWPLMVQSPPSTFNGTSSLREMNDQGPSHPACPVQNMPHSSAFQFQTPIQTPTQTQNQTPTQALATPLQPNQNLTAYPNGFNYAQGLITPPSTSSPSHDQAGAQDRPQPKRFEEQSKHNLMPQESFLQSAPHPWENSESGQAQSLGQSIFPFQDSTLPAWENTQSIEMDSYENSCNSFEDWLVNDPVVNEADLGMFSMVEEKAPASLASAASTPCPAFPKFSAIPGTAASAASTASAAFPACVASMASNTTANIGVEQSLTINPIDTLHDPSMVGGMSPQVEISCNFLESNDYSSHLSLGFGDLSSWMEF